MEDEKYVVGIGYKKVVRTLLKYKEYNEMMLSELKKIAIRYESNKSIKAYREGLDICFVLKDKQLAWSFHNEVGKLKQVTETTHISLEEALKRTEEIKKK